MKRLAIFIFTYGFLLWNVSPLAAFTPTSDGLYAVFTTNQGEFTAQLEFEKVPSTVANFVGLTEGTWGWMNLDNGEIRTERYYDGLTFHRVSTDFVIQGGSRNGLGTDGPGYRFDDEFDSSLRHDSAGVLSMANSGANTNGSQFFITLRATPVLDDRHSVFGRIVEGLSIVQSIGNVATGANEKPIEDVIIERIDIVRQGSAAAAFHASEKYIPKLSGVPNFELDLSDDKVAMVFQRKANAIYTVYEFSNFNAWYRLGEIGFSQVDPDFRLILVDPSRTSAPLDVLPKENGKGLFFRIIETDYTNIE
mgnify:CR=1 FL=1